MTMDLSQSWLGQVGKGPGRDAFAVIGLLAITVGALAISLSFLPSGAPPSVLFIGRALTAIGGFFLALPLFLGAMGEERWSNGVRIAGLVVGFFVILVTLIRI